MATSETSKEEIQETESTTESTTESQDENISEADQDESPSFTVDNTKSKYDVLVVDTAALIKGVRLETIASEFFTITEVLNEVKDKQARTFLETFPFEIKMREPSPEAIQHGEIYVGMTFVE
jgi:rRNA maturation endonuclease Nob1